MSWIAEKTKMAESERARRASEDSAGGAKLTPDPEVTERPSVDGSPRSTSYALFAKPTPVRAMGMWAHCFAARVCTPRSSGCHN